jgi:hypothetical protein
MRRIPLLALLGSDIDDQPILDDAKERRDPTPLLTPGHVSTPLSSRR